MQEIKGLHGDCGHQDDAGRLINIVSHQLKRTIRLSAQIEKGLTNMQNRVLHFILMKTLEETVYQKDIEKEFHIRKSTASEILQLMEKNGYIYRECSKEDARMKKILPTEKAVAIRRQVIEGIGEIEDRLRQGIKEEDFQICIQVLKQMARNLSDDSRQTPGSEE